MKAQSSEMSEIYAVLCPRSLGISGNETSGSLLSAVCHQQLVPICEAGLHIRGFHCCVKNSSSSLEALPSPAGTWQSRSYVTSHLLVASCRNRCWLAYAKREKRRKKKKEKQWKIPEAFHVTEGRTKKLVDRGRSGGLSSRTPISLEMNAAHQGGLGSLPFTAYLPSRESDWCF